MDASAAEVVVHKMQQFKKCVQEATVIQISGAEGTYASHVNGLFEGMDEEGVANQAEAAVRAQAAG